MSDTYRKDKGYAGEDMALAYYRERGYRLIQQNYTIPGGEIDLIMTDEKTLVFVEVKVMDYLDDMYDYITPAKRKALERTIETYLRTSPSQLIQRLDVVFIHQGKIVEVFEDVTGG